MPSGFVVPQDHHERRRFAERNGLEWIDPDQAVSLLEDTTEQQTPDELGEEE
jgi:hypothetical protein